jgi:hypothetical protein
MGKGIIIFLVLLFFPLVFLCFTEDRSFVVAVLFCCFSLSFLSWFVAQAGLELLILLQYWDYRTLSHAWLLKEVFK